MRNLLAAGCSRLWKSWYFRGLFVLMCLMNGYMALANRRQILQLFQGQMPVSVFFGHTLFIGIATAVLVGFFIGDEYSDKTLRNKILCGYDRKIIYLTYFVECFIGMAICHLAAILCGFIFGMLTIGTLTIPYSLLFIYILYSFSALAVMCALSLLIVTVSQSKTIGIAVADCVAFLSLFCGSGLVSMLLTGARKDSVWLDLSADVYLNKIRAYEDLFVNEAIEEIAFPTGLIVIMLVLLAIGMAIFARRDIK